MTKKKLALKLLMLMDHLDWIGWGDNYEREVSEPLRSELTQMRDDIERAAGVYEEPGS